MSGQAAQGRRVAVIGGGWAGLAAAVEATRRGHAVTLFEMAPTLGGRARSVDALLDNGQHILIGAYGETLRLMRLVGVDPDEALLRTPLQLVDAAGRGLRLAPGSPALAFARAVWANPAWTRRERAALLCQAAGWALRGFQAHPSASVQALCRRLPRKVCTDLVDPLCVAALNTPPAQASAAVFLRVMRDALLGGPGSADLLLPRRRLGDLFPVPAARWLDEAGASLRTSARVQRLEPAGEAWQVDGDRFQRVIVATSPGEAARLVRPFAPAWADHAMALEHEPIITVYLESPGSRLPSPMIALAANDDDAPAQFVFDHGLLGGRPGVLAFVISGARPWVERGAAATLDATMRQAREALGSHLRSPLTELRLLTDKRATFRCTPGLRRPPASIAAGLLAAGDYIDGPYPATLEAAVRSGLDAAAQLA